MIEILTRIEQQNLTILATLAPKTNKRFLSVEEAAARLGRSIWTIRQLCLTERILAIKGNDGCWQIPADEVVRLETEGVPKLPKR
jgi:hypothetical protein